MPTIVHERDVTDPPDPAPDDPPVIFERMFKITTPDGTEETYTPDEACDLIASLVCEQFWDWFLNPASKRRFKPRIKLYEVY
jgi:hypothetical protein